jgi:hypothetical protein
MTWADLQPEGQASSSARVQPEVKGQPRLEPVNRQQMVWRTIDVERLIEEDHPARAIWELVGKLDLSSFRQAIGAVEGKVDARRWTRSCYRPVDLRLQRGSGFGARDRPPV